MTNFAIADDAIDGGPFDCVATVRRLWDYLDHELSYAEMQAVDAHLAACEKCPPHFVFERRFLDALKTAREDAGASATLRNRVRAILGVTAIEDPSHD